MGRLPTVISRQYLCNLDLQDRNTATTAMMLKQQLVSKQCVSRMREMQQTRSAGKAGVAT